MQIAASRVELADIAGLEDLPSPPMVAMEILRLSRSEDVGIDEFAQVLSTDAAMASKVIRVANSAAYRRRTEAVTLVDAANRLGLRSLGVIALGFSLVRDLPSSGRLAGMDLAAYWRRSLTVAVMARRFATRALPQLTQEAFVVGLFAHIGRLVLAQHATGLYQQVVDDGDGWPSSTLERQHLGFSNTEIAAALLRSWNLPASMVEAVEQLDDRPAVTPDLDLPQVVRAAMTADAVLSDAADTDALVALDEFASVLLGEDHASESLLEGSAAELAEALEIFELGDVGSLDFDSLLDESRQRLVAVSTDLAGELEVQEQESRALRREIEELQERVREDALTRLPNRAALQEFLQRELQLRRRSTQRDAIGVLLVDVDRFKLLNDEHGHQVGDDVLKLVAAALSSSCRQGDLLARYGGEEFVLVAPSCTVEDLRTLGERLREDVEQLSIQVGDKMLSVTVSVGGACARDVEVYEDAEHLIQKADSYLYRAKRRGRNRTEVSPEDVL
jgi:diguanylate cyclase (GGDEF)-like protein